MNEFADFVAQSNENIVARRFLDSFPFGVSFRAGLRYLHFVTEEFLHFGLVVLDQSILVCNVHVKEK